MKRYKSTYAPEKSFFNKYIEKAKGEILATEEVKAKFLGYVAEIGVTVHRMDIWKYIMDNHRDVTKDRKRLNDINGEDKKSKKKNAVHVYKGLRFKNC